VPWQYGFPRTFALGNLREDRLPQLAKSWAADVLPALHDIARAAAEPLGEPGAPAVINGYERLAWAALASAGRGG
jgi:hypothetical protein